MSDEPKHDWAWQAVYDVMVEATTDATYSKRSPPDLMDDLAARMAQRLRDVREACDARWRYAVINTLPRMDEDDFERRLNDIIRTRTDRESQE